VVASKVSAVSTCWANYFGYRCCTNTKNVVYSNESGKWGKENNDWCGINEKEDPNCWANKFGLSCCKTTNVEVLKDKNGSWGTENDDWCGIIKGTSVSPTTNKPESDITGNYIKNPSFEQDNINSLAKDNTRGAFVAKSVVGWNLSGSYGTSGYSVSDIMTSSTKATDNNFGAPGNPSDGKQMYYIRDAWNASTASLLQSVTLPAGKYRLTLDNKCVTTSSHTAYLVAGEERVTLPFNKSLPTKWTTTELVFQLTKETTLSIGIKVEFGSGSGGSILVDNFRLYGSKSA